MKSCTEIRQLIKDFEIAVNKAGYISWYACVYTTDPNVKTSYRDEVGDKIKSVREEVRRVVWDNMGEATFFAYSANGDTFPFDNMITEDVPRRLFPSLIRI